MNNGMWKSGLITPPPRESLLGSAIVLLVVGVMSFALVLPGDGGRFTLFVLSLFLLVAIIKKSVFAIHIALLGLLLFLPANFGAPFRFWPLNILTPLIIYALIVSMVPVLRKSMYWPHKGRTDVKVSALVIAIVILSVIALVGWVIVIKPDLKQHISLIPELPFWMYPFAGVSFAVLNSVMEEVIFRGIVMEALDSSIGPGFCSVGIQAVPFAALHYLAGFPHGVSGFIMVLIYGVMLGAIRRSSKGMLAPIVAHIAADITIFSILIFILFQ